MIMMMIMITIMIFTLMIMISVMIVTLIKWILNNSDKNSINNKDNANGIITPMIVTSMPITIIKSL